MLLLILLLSSRMVLDVGATAADNPLSDPIARAGTWSLLGSKRLSQVAVLTNVINNASSYSRVRRSHFRLLPAAPLHCPIVLPLAPSLLPLKRPCSLSRSKTVIANPKFGVYIIYILSPNWGQHMTGRWFSGRRFAPPLTPISSIYSLATLPYSLVALPCSLAALFYSHIAPPCSPSVTF